LECVEYYLIFRFLGQNINVFGGVVLLTTASLIGNLMFLIPMQAGTREGGMAMALTFLGIDAAVGVVGALIYRIRDLLCILIGVSLIMFDKKKKEKVQKEAPPEGAAEDAAPAQGEGQTEEEAVKDEDVAKEEIAEQDLPADLPADSPPTEEEK